MIDGSGFDPVRKVTPVLATPPSPLVPTAPWTSVSLIVPAASVEAPTSAEEAIVTNAGSLLPSPVALAQPEASIVSAPVAVSLALAPEVLPVASASPSLTRSPDLGASLSLVALGTNKVVPAASTGPASVKSSTSVLDEMYRQLGTMESVPLVNGYSRGATEEWTIEELAEVWDLEYMLADED